MKKSLDDAHRIAEYLNEFLSRIKIHNQTGLYDVNRLAQDLCGNILNIIHYQSNLNLTNLDLIKWNYEAVDLGDKTTGIVFQITTERNLRKIFKTIDQFVGTDDFKTGVLTDLRFLILNEAKWNKSQKSAIRKKFRDNGLPYTWGKQMVLIGDLPKGIKQLPNTKKAELKTILENEFGKKDDSTNEFDKKLFREYDGIMNEDALINFYQGLSGGRPYDCLGLTTDIINPYWQQACKVTGQYFNRDIQNAHEKVVLSIRKLRAFLIRNYTTNGVNESLMIPLYLKGTSRVLYHEKAVTRLDAILDETVRNFQSYRKKVRDQYFL